jgi:hypothetical protein
VDKNGTTPYNIAWTDATGVKHNMVSTDPTTDIANAKIGAFNPVVTNASGDGTTVNVGGADSAAQTEAKAEAQKSGDAADERQNTMLKAAAAAPDNIARFEALRDVLAHSNTGPGAPLAGTVVGWATQLGVPPSVIEGLGLNPNQAMTNDIAQKITNKMVAESIGARNGGFPATGFNLAERQFVEKMFPNIQSQPGANLANSDMLIALEQQKMDMADEFGAYRLTSYSDCEDQ